MCEEGAHVRGGVCVRTVRVWEMRVRRCTCEFVREVDTRGKAPAGLGRRLRARQGAGSRRLEG